MQWSLPPIGDKSLIQQHVIISAKRMCNSLLRSKIIWYFWRVHAPSFEPFMQRRTEETADIGGTGLGLAIVKSLVELMQGTIRVESVFKWRNNLYGDLELQACETRWCNGTAECLTRFWEIKKVRIVEDNELNADIAVQMLASTGHSCWTCP